MSRLPREDTLRSTRVRTVHHGSALGWWSMSLSEPHPAIAPYLRIYCGWEEETRSALWRIEPAGPDAPLIIRFENPVLALDGGSTRPLRRTALS